MQKKKNHEQEKSWDSKLILKNEIVSQKDLRIYRWNGRKNISFVLHVLFSQKLITAYGTSFKQNNVGTSVITDFTECSDNSKWVLMCISNSNLVKFSIYIGTWPDYKLPAQ